MADVDFEEFEDGCDPPASGRMGRFVHLAGAGCSVALILGMAIWGYKLAVRDVSGIPVVRALPDPMRIAPVSPGGVETMHQGLSVNAVAAAGTVSPLPETLILAPPEIDLASDDVPGLGAVDQTAAGTAVVASSTAPARVVVDDVVAVSAATEGAANVAADAMAAEDGVADTMTEDDAVAAALASALGSQDSTMPGDAGDGIGAGIAASPRPRARPDAISASVSAAAPAADGTPAAVAATEVDSATIAVGTRLVQLGAFDDEAAARAEWARLATQFPDLLAAKSMVIQPAQSGGRTFFRLRATGFDDEDQARKFCAVFLVQNASCIPVTQK